MIEDIVNENIEQFKYVFWLDWSNKVKYIDLFKRGITSGDTLGLFFIKDSKAVCELVKYYKDFKRIIIYDSNATTSLLKDYDSINEFNDPRVEYIEIGQDLPMKFDKIIMNPPYNLGNKITEAVLSVLEDNGECICLQPLSQYKKKDLYRHVDMFELADPKLFEDAVITENLSICSLKKENVDKYAWMDLVLKSVDQRYIEFYKWNIEHNKGLAWTEVKNKAASNFNVDYDFLETSRCVTECGGGRFGPASFGYAWNVLKNTSSINARMTYLHFLDSKSKQNFVKYIYSWTSSDKRDQTLNYKALIGMKTDGPSREYYFGIPQIDWANIHINQKELWDKGDYDNAVLSEMGLKWNEDKTVIVKDE